jgi:hypothetical protein
LTGKDKKSAALVKDRLAKAQDIDTTGARSPDTASVAMRCRPTQQPPGSNWRGFVPPGRSWNG